MLLGTEGSFGKSAQPSNEEQLRKLILQEIKNPNKASASLKVENLINDNWALCTKESILLNHTKLIKQSSLKGFVNGEEISRLSPLDFAVESNNVQIASLLLMLCVQKKWIIPGHSGGLLHIATRYNSVDMIKLLTSQFKTPESARVLVNFGLDELDEDGLTCLMIAAWNGFEEIVSHLLSRGADWKLEDKNKHNSLFRAALHFQKEVLYTMAQQKVDLNCRNSNGTTPLIELVKRGEEDQIIYYISLGAQVNFTDANQRTPLHHASFGDLTIFFSTCSK